MKAKLFISHASEDKPDFVRPLADALNISFDIWYDDYVLTMGDPLRQKIDEGLAACDYGIVVLSRAFFSKHWPQAELDGLFSLEKKRGKIILPIWKGIDEAGVASFSPILASRLAAKDSDGLDSIVSQIKQAVEAGERKAAFTGVAAAKARLLTLAQQAAEDSAAERLASSEEGVQLTAQAAAAFCESLERTFTDFQNDQSVFKFRIERNNQAARLNVFASYKLGLHVSYWNNIINSVRDARLTVVLHECLNPLRQHDENGRRFFDIDYSPWFDADKNIVWRSSKDSLFTTEQLVERTVGDFINTLETLRRASMDKRK